VKTVCVLQHVEAEYLGLIEDHLEGRSIRFNYCRPFAGAKVPEGANQYDGLIVLGGGPLGVVSGPLIPSLAPELRLMRDFLARRLPVVGIGIGSVLLAVAAGGGALEESLRFSVGTVARADANALGGAMPERFPAAVYMRDRPVLPADARILARDEIGTPAVFAIGDAAIGFLGHPGLKSAMVEDLIMEFDETPPGTAEGLVALRSVQAAIAESLAAMMVGIVRQTGWM
jgi:GMP synthase-like glutamine amidotransferase